MALLSLQHAIYLVSPSVAIEAVYLNLQDRCYNVFFFTKLHYLASYLSCVHWGAVAVELA